MKITSLKFVNEDLKQVLLPLLENTIFHMSSQNSYDSIIKDGKIKNNKNNQYPFNPTSDVSFGTRHGYICLFNLKDHDRATVEETLVEHYNFLRPSWFLTFYEDRSECKIAYFILHDKCYNLIIGNEAAIGSGAQYVPKTECWIEHEISLDNISEILLVTIVDIPTDFLSKAAHAIGVVNQNIKKTANNSVQ